MDSNHLGADAQAMLQEMLGYLNFSSGATDARFLRNINELARLIDAGPGDRAEPWQILASLLRARLEALRGTSDAFRHVEQVEAVLGLVFDKVLPAYRQHHRDLLFHQTTASLFQPFFLGRVFEAVLLQGGPWEEADRIVEGSLATLNDFIGYRPVAVLRTAQRIEPYAHERVRPVPLFIRAAGVAVGRYHDLIEQALAILEATDPAILDQAWFDPAMMDELALDPRAYDFDHPVDRRPNYHFGQWDPHHLDNQGRYRRLVLQQVTLDALLERVETSGELPREELSFEAAAVLAGTILMASGTCGNGPDAHDSSVTLSKLLPKIAVYRDAFYESLLETLPNPRGERLRAEAVSQRQPFGGARRHLNHALARRRAMQLEHVHLAQLFARMGYPDAAERQADVVPAASARMICQMNCRLTAAHRAIDRGWLSDAARLASEIEQILHRGIECGALIDPWNILGFQGQFSLFPSPENSTYDHRVDQLTDLVDQIFGLYARLASEAAAVGDAELETLLSTGLERLARWWDQYASIEVSNVHGISGREAWESARHVATALGAWCQAGAAAGDLAFWRQHVDRFNSPKAYGLVIEALLEKRDFVASMALLMQWLGQSEQIPLENGGYSFDAMAVRWMGELCRTDLPDKSSPPGRAIAPDERRALARKFLDFLEANAEDYWEVPHLELTVEKSPRAPEGDEAELEGEPEDPFRAAYDEMTYRDSTGDGVEGETLETGSRPGDYELELEAVRIGKRLRFLAAVARLWMLAGVAPGTKTGAAREWDETLGNWFFRAISNRGRLLKLLAAIHERTIPTPTGSHESLVEYDRRRVVKESLLEQGIMTAVEVSGAARLLLAAARRPRSAAGLEEWERQAAGVLRAILRQDAAEIRARWPELIESLGRQPLLYVPLVRRGNPAAIVQARSVQRLLCDLLVCLPRLGLLREACQLIETAQAMEKDHPGGPGAVTEFDHLFEIGYKALVESLVVVSQDWELPKRHRRGAARKAEDDLIECLQRMTEIMLARWLLHSRALRLSVLEEVIPNDRWNSLVKFIQRYGKDLFIQRFFNLGNLRAILHQGADAWLARLEEGPDEDRLRLVEDLDRAIPRREAADKLRLVIEAVVENFTEYKDYNSTTTQSDRGELLYTLLDFLRLKVVYDRVAWNLKPVFMAHEILVRRGKMEAAELWRRAIVQRTSEVADQQIRRLARLSRNYGMQLPTIEDRLQERFVRPLAIDRLRALIRPAIEEARAGEPPKSFAALEQEVDELTQEPSGVGFDVPAWLLALEEEVDQAWLSDSSARAWGETPVRIPQTPLALEDVQSQLEGWDLPRSVWDQ
jgi:hypothetical protein